MILISHRGNLRGPEPRRENSPDYVLAALQAGYNCETDVWYHGSEWYLGHDSPTYLIDFSFFEHKKLWLHAKSVVTINEFVLRAWDLPLNFFWHQHDDAVLTSGGFLWTAPGKEIVEMSIACCPEMVKNWNIKGAAGVCSDWITKYK